MRRNLGAKPILYPQPVFIPAASSAGCCPKGKPLLLPRANTIAGGLRAFGRPPVSVWVFGRQAVCS